VHDGAIAGHGRWSRARGAQNEEETEGILTKVFTTKGCPRGKLAIVVLPLHGSPQLGGFLLADSRLGVLKRHHHVHAVLYKVLMGLGKRCHAAAAMELELDSCDREKLSWGRWEGYFMGLGVRVQYLESKSQLNRGFP
jgi:hypothetical protein